MSDIDSKSIDELCQLAEQLAEEADDEIPKEDKVLPKKESSEQLSILDLPSKKVRGRKVEKDKGYVAAGMVFQSANTEVLKSASRKASSVNRPGFLRSTEGPDSAVPCGEGYYEYPEPKCQYKGHAEAKIIENVFSEARRRPDPLTLFDTPGWSGPKEGLPKGKLVIKLKGYTTKDKSKPEPCSESCNELIKCANQIEGFEVKICPHEEKDKKD